MIGKFLVAIVVAGSRMILAGEEKPVQPVSQNSAAYTMAYYRVSVDYSRSLGDMVAAGKYDRVYKNIKEENFPIQRADTTPTAMKAPSGETGRYRVQNVDLEIVLVHLNREVSTDEVLRYMEQFGLRPARIEELLALGETYPGIQLKFSVAALGSSWVDRAGDRQVPLLNRDGNERHFRLRWSGVDWSRYFRFAAIRK